MSSMRMFDFEEIKRAADCRELCESVLGLRPVNRSSEWWAFNNPWRVGSDSGAFKVSREGYHDHVSGESGSAIDLIAHAKFGGDILQAQNFLGEHYKIRTFIEPRQKRKLVATYDYVDADGKLVHQTVRWEPKEFSQRRPDPDRPGEWVWSLKDIKPVLYRLPALIASPWVCVVGGEKDADNLVALGIPATTNPMGEGNWEDHYNACFKDKVVIILPDLDTVGRRHAKYVAHALKGIAKSIRIIELPFPPDASPDKDASDWIAYHRETGTSEASIANSLKALAKDTPALDMDKIEPPESTQQEISLLAQAKAANKKPFRSYDEIEVADAKGRKVQQKVPRTANNMVADLMVRFLGFPRRVGSTLFDHDRDTGEITMLNRTERLMAWIQLKSKHATNCPDTAGFVKPKELFEALSMHVTRYESISGVPHWPKRQNVYYTHGAMPDPDPEARRFTEFCQFFSPATEVDWHLLRAFVASPLYFRPRIPRPIWVIDAKDGQGTGKTVCASMLAYLYGGNDEDSRDPHWISAEKLNNETLGERIIRELLSGGGRKRNIVIIDNVVGYLRSPELARLCTQPSITGLAPYGHTQESRPNDLTWIITSNSATLDTDLSDRSLYIQLCKPKHYADDWTSKVLSFVDDHRPQIIADIIGILDRGPQFPLDCATRFKDWERAVLAPICRDRETWQSVVGNNTDRQRESNVEIEQAAEIADIIQHHVTKAIGQDVDLKPVWIQSSVLAKWILDSMPKYGGGSQQGCLSHVKNAIKKGHITLLSDRMEAWPPNSIGTLRKHRGYMYNERRYSIDEARVWIIGKEGDGSVTVTLTPTLESDK